MSYQGQLFRFPLGTQGLMLDGPQTRMPIDSLLETRNLALWRGIVETAQGSVRWNKTPIGCSIVALSDFWPDDVSQRLFTVGSDALLRRHLDYASTSIVGPASASDAQAITLATNSPPVFVPGGAVDGTDNRLLFLFTGTTQVQVVDGDATTRRDIAKPAVDWDSSFPTAGCIHAGRLIAWGNRNLPHQLYISSATDHEDFQTNGAALFFPVFPGESEGIVSCYDFKGRLFIAKYPYGIYYLDDTDPNIANWRIRKLTASFGVASAFSCVEGLNDLFVANSQGSITQMSATLDFGSMTTGNVLRNLRCESFIRDRTSRIGYLQRHGVWYEDKKTALFTYRSSGSVTNDLMLSLDFNDPSTIKAHWGDKDQANCLALVKDSTYIMRPFYGANDGYIYRMDSGTYDVGGNAYTSSFKTMNQDFGQATAPGQQNIAEEEKLYDFLEVTFEEAGNWNLSVDVYIDNYFSETLTINMTKEQYLGNFNLGPTGVNQALGRSPQSFRVPLHGKGRRIAFKCHISTLRQYFRISDMVVYFRLAGQEQED